MPFIFGIRSNTDPPASFYRLAIFCALGINLQQPFKAMNMAGPHRNAPKKSPSPSRFRVEKDAGVGNHSECVRFEMSTTYRRGIAALELPSTIKPRSVVGVIQWRGNQTVPNVSGVKRTGPVGGGRGTFEPPGMTITESESEALTSLRMLQQRPEW
ncbi:hypothetical protein BDR03DRAFT_988060 [Suillus americanus]|nr:hypothetical protein BDR03DRAFT_988060 [Suillus americanus]